MTTSFPAYVARKQDDGSVRAAVESLTIDDLPPGDVLIRARYSSLNYKDALAATGHPGIAKTFPHVPGVDVAGVVEESAADAFEPGEEVLVTGYAMGDSRWGGYSGFVRVPADFVVPLPAGLSLWEAMIYGTAGFTAGQSVQAIVEQGIDRGRGPVVVTGASGGVGSLAVGILAKEGFAVTAVTGKPEAHELLARLGATEVIGRGDVDDASDRPLLSARWSSAVDTVGGNILATILRSTMHRGVVTACGLVAGAELPLSVYPFILRGVSLVGIDSQKCPHEPRRAIWQKLAGDWKLDNLEALATTIKLSQLDEYVQTILRGGIVGRTVVELSQAKG